MVLTSVVKLTHFVFTCALVSTEERIHLVVERCPKILGCSVDRNLRPTVAFLTEEVGMSVEDVSQV
jgi:hypothetical protein